VRRLELDEAAERRGHADLVDLRVGPARQHTPTPAFLAQVMRSGRSIVAAEAEALPPEEGPAGGEAGLHLVDDQRQLAWARAGVQQAEQELAARCTSPPSAIIGSMMHGVELVAASVEDALEGVELGGAEDRFEAGDLERHALPRAPGGHQRGAKVRP
jgi:hypothetical protein